LESLFSKQFIINFLQELFILILSVIIDMAKKSKLDREYEEAVKWLRWVRSLPKAKKDKIIYDILEKSSRGAKENAR